MKQKNSIFRFRRNFHIRTTSQSEYEEFLEIALNWDSLNE
jgi:hypothetical protein